MAEGGDRLDPAGFVVQLSGASSQRLPDGSVRERRRAGSVRKPLARRTFCEGDGTEVGGERRLPMTLLDAEYAFPYHSVRDAFSAVSRYYVARRDASSPALLFSVAPVGDGVWVSEVETLHDLGAGARLVRADLYSFPSSISAIERAMRGSGWYDAEEADRFLDGLAGELLGEVTRADSAARRDGHEVVKETVRLRENHDLLIRRIVAEDPIRAARHFSAMRHAGTPSGSADELVRGDIAALLQETLSAGAPPAAGASEPARSLLFRECAAKVLHRSVTPIPVSDHLAKLLQRDPAGKGELYGRVRALFLTCRRAQLLRRGEAIPSYHALRRRARGPGALAFVDSPVEFRPSQSRWRPAGGGEETRRAAGHILEYLGAPSESGDPLTYERLADPGSLRRFVRSRAGLPEGCVASVGAEPLWIAPGAVEHQIRTTDFGYRSGVPDVLPGQLALQSGTITDANWRKAVAEVLEACAAAVDAQRGLVVVSVADAGGDGTALFQAHLVRLLKFLPVTCMGQQFPQGEQQPEAVEVVDGEPASLLFRSGDTESTVALAALSHSHRPPGGAPLVRLESEEEDALAEAVAVLREQDQALVAFGEDLYSYGYHIPRLAMHPDFDISCEVHHRPAYVHLGPPSARLLYARPMPNLEDVTSLRHALRRLPPEPETGLNVE